MKLCTRCGETKDKALFAVARRAPDGLQVWCKVCMKASNRAYTAAKPQKARLYYYRSYDKAKGFDNDLTEDFATRLTTLPCEYCGTAEQIRGLDRIDNSLGHLQSNVVPCCHRCNTTRMDNFTHAEFKLLGPTLALIDKARNEQKTSTGQSLGTVES